MSEPEQGAPPGAPIDASDDAPSGATVSTTAGAASAFVGDGEPIPAPGTYPSALDDLRAESRPLLSGVSRDIAEAHRTTVLAWELGAPHMRRAPLSRLARSGRHREAAPTLSTAAQKAARRNERKASRAGTRPDRRVMGRGLAGLLAALTDEPQTAA